MACRRCGEILNANANFCWSCGAPQHDATSPETIAVPVVSVHDALSPQGRSEPPAPHGDVLVIVAGTSREQSFVIVSDVFSAGRHEESDVLLDDVSVSRHHAVFTRTASGRITVRDLNSLNGTYVNGARVEEVSLHSADEIQIGKYKLIFWQAA